MYWTTFEATLWGVYEGLSVGETTGYKQT